MLAAGFGRAHAGGHALADERGLPFGHRADDGEHRPAHRALGVDLILDADKAHAEVVEILERGHAIELWRDPHLVHLVKHSALSSILKAGSWFGERTARTGSRGKRGRSEE